MSPRTSVSTLCPRRSAHQIFSGERGPLKGCVQGAHPPPQPILRGMSDGVQSRPMEKSTDAVSMSTWSNAFGSYIMNCVGGRGVPPPPQYSPIIVHPLDDLDAPFPYAVFPPDIQRTCPGYHRTAFRTRGSQPVVGHGVPLEMG